MSDKRIKKEQNPWTKGEKFLLGSIVLTALLAGGLTITIWQWNINPTISVPTPAMPSPNAFDYDTAAANSVVDDIKIIYAHENHAQPVPPTISGPGGRPGAGLPMRAASTQPKSAAELAADFVATHVYSLPEKEALVQENSNALKLLHQSFIHPYRNPLLRRNDQDTPYYAEFRRLGRLLTLTGDVQAAQGDWNGALNTGLDAIRFGEDIPRGGALTARMIGIHIGETGQRAAWQATGHVTAAQARAAICRLEQIQANHLPLWQTLQEEKWAMQSALLEMFHHPGWYERWLTESKCGGCVGGCDITPADYPRPLSEDWWRHLGMHVLLLRDSKRTIMRNYADTMDQEIANTRRPYAAHPPAPEMTGDPISSEIVPVYDGVWFRERADVTENALLAVALALRAYRLEHRAYPATLNTLTPTYMHSVPDDTFAPSGPLHYRQVGTNYILYSVGPDGKDDGGRPIFDAKKTPPDAWHTLDPRYTVEQKGQGDIVAGLNTNSH